MTRIITLVFLAMLTSSCVTSGNFCDLASEIHPSKKDVLTLGTKQQILELDLKYQKMCK